MKALLLAAGFGTRLKPLTDFLPKCLVAIHEKPLLQYWLDMLLPDKVEHVLINTHYLSSQVEEFIKSSPWAAQVALVHESELLGTGGTVLENREFLQDGPFILAHADNLTRFDVDAFTRAHANRPHEAEITMMTFDTDVPQSCGIIEMDDRGLVHAFYEKSPEFHGNRANAAVYIIEPNVINFLSSLNKNIIDFSTEVLPHYIGRISTYHNADYHRDIGTPESLALAQVEF
jgi:mannose-1-phosphate guanylyltransferase